MLDGFAARKTDTVSKLGARLDAVADFVFAVVSLIKHRAETPRVSAPALPAGRRSCSCGWIFDNGE